MFKTLKQKLNKKGFTLAELLVVVAIIAILVAIAIPIFTGALRDAQMRVNQANIRSVKGEAVTAILSNWSKYDDNHHLISSGMTHGWAAQAKVSKTGDVTDLKLFVMQNTVQAEALTGVTTKALPSTPGNLTTADGVTGTLANNGKLETVAVPDDGYYVQVYVTAEEYQAKTS